MTFIFRSTVMAYMEMFGNCSHGNTTEFLRHSVHTYSLLQAEWQQSQTTLSSTHSCSFNAFSHSSSQRLLLYLEKYNNHFILGVLSLHICSVLQFCFLFEVYRFEYIHLRLICFFGV